MPIKTCFLDPVSEWPLPEESPVEEIINQDENPSRTKLPKKKQTRRPKVSPQRKG